MTQSLYQEAEKWSVTLQLLMQEARRETMITRQPGNRKENDITQQILSTKLGVQRSWHL